MSKNCVPLIMLFPVIVYVALAGPEAPTVLIDAPFFEADIESAMVISLGMFYQPQRGVWLVVEDEKTERVTRDTTPRVVRDTRLPGDRSAV